jgi:hypothetical protein
VLGQNDLGGYYEFRPQPLPLFKSSHKQPQTAKNKKIFTTKFTKYTEFHEKTKRYVFF